MVKQNKNSVIIHKVPQGQPPKQNTESLGKLLTQYVNMMPTQSSHVPLVLYDAAVGVNVRATECFTTPDVSFIVVKGLRENLT